MPAVDPRMSLTVRCGSCTKMKIAPASSNNTAYNYLFEEQQNVYFHDVSINGVFYQHYQQSRMMTLRVSTNTQFPTRHSYTII
ncbi:CLUMA_CG005402, isoform A [Clunio marinus]|uniref:CLUMA_CG005402, isoform A n=1 Tax=Clunio marinus TaxID=568069 RepID=A0A1J1HW42_9DIPT|nr:CLUMA_CG005402, isoform A [Clunio marinus]